MRATLGALAAATVIGGGLIALQAFLHLTSDTPPTNLDGVGWWCVFTGLLALALYSGGALAAPVIGRIGAGVGIAIGGYLVSHMLATGVSRWTSDGYARYTVEDLVTGVFWLSAGVVFAVAVLRGLWPAARRTTETEYPL